MCLSNPTMVFLIVMASMTSIQAQRAKILTSSLVIYDPKSQKQASLVDIRPIASRQGNKVELVDLPIYWSPCQIQMLKFICCIGIRIPNKNIDKKVCVQITFHVNTLKTQITISVQNRVLLDMGVSVISPPTLCIPTLLPVPLLICLKIFDIFLPFGTDFQCCFSLLLRFLVQKAYEFKLACVRLGSGGISLFRPAHLDEIVSSEDERENIERGDNDGISLEGLR